LCSQRKKNGCQRQNPTHYLGQVKVATTAMELLGVPNESNHRMGAIRLIQAHAGILQHLVLRPDMILLGMCQETHSQSRLTKGGISKTNTTLTRVCHDPECLRLKLGLVRMHRRIPK